MEPVAASPKRETRTAVLLLVPDLPAQGAAILALGLPRDRFRVVMLVLGPAPESAGGELRAAGVEVYSIPVRHALDLSGIRRFRQLVREESPEIIHAFGPLAARLSRLVVSRSGGGNSPRVVISGAAIPGSGVTGWLTARQVRRADRVIPTTRAEGDRYRGFGVPPDILTRIAPAAPPPPPTPDPSAILANLGVPPDARIIVAGGSATRPARVKDVIVAFDMLRYEARDLHLVIFGTGSTATALEHFGRALAFDDFRIHFAPDWSGRPPAVGVALAVWITDPWSGTDEALEAMAAGKPVVGWNTPDLAEVVEDRQTGILVPPGDRAALAAGARVLIEEPGRATAMGEAGRLRAAERFSPAKMVEQFVQAYAELAEPLVAVK